MLFTNGRYANVASTLALVVALGGTSYAAVAIPKNSVGSKQIVNSSVKSVDVRNGSLTGADFKAGEIPAGPRGPAGPQGPAGPAGASGSSHGYSVDLGVEELDWPLVENTEVTVASLNLPAGSYVVHAKALANNNSNTAASATCELTSGATVVDAGANVVRLGANLAVDRAYLSLSGTVTSAAPITLSLDCRADQALGNWTSAVITAVKVDSVN